MSPSSGDPFPGARVIAESGTCAECGRDVYVGDIHFCGQDAPRPVSGREMCELIADVHFRRTGETIDPEVIWNASPTGELAHVWDLYVEALAWRNANVDFVGRVGGLAAGRAVIADAIVECPDWLSGADAVTVLSWAPRVGDSVADRLYALSGARQRHLLRELTVRQLGVLGSGLRALGETR